MKPTEKIKKSALAYSNRWLKFFLKKEEMKSKELETQQEIFWLCLEDELGYDDNINSKEFIRSLKKNIEEENEERNMWKQFENQLKEKQLKQDLQNGQVTRELFNLK